MEQIKVSISSYMKEQTKSRAEQLGLSNSGYFRILSDLDIAIQRYQSLAVYINSLYNKINETQIKLGIYATPLQEIPIINVDKLA